MENTEISPLSFVSHLCLLFTFEYYYSKQPPRDYGLRSRIVSDTLHRGSKQGHRQRAGPVCPDARSRAPPELKPIGFPRGIPLRACDPNLNPVS